MHRRAFLQSVILGALAAPFVTRQARAETPRLWIHPHANGIITDIQAVHYDEPITFNGHHVIWDSWELGPTPESPTILIVHRP
jgi:hypothetical protein